MAKRERIYYWLILFVFTLFVVSEVFKPEPVNWDFSFSGKDKIPFGCKVLRENLGDIVPGSEISESFVNPYVLLDSTMFDNSTYLFLSDMFYPDQAETGELFKFAERGNNVFVSSLGFGRNFLDTLGIEMGFYFNNEVAFEDTSVLFLLNPDLEKKGGYAFDKLTWHQYFSGFDTASTYLLGQDYEKRANFIKIPVGKGALFLHSAPLAFTNYHILYGDSSYTSSVLSYVASPKIIWDEYHKPVRMFAELKPATPLRFILQQPPLKTAYYLLIATLLLFVFFEAKRRQRIIPVKKPLKNTSLQFVETVGRLYFNRKNHKDLVRKKMIYFSSFIQEKYFFKFIPGDEHSIMHLSMKSGVDAMKIRKISDVYLHVMGQSSVSDDDLAYFSSLNEEFYKNCN